MRNSYSDAIFCCLTHIVTYFSHIFFKFESATNKYIFWEGRRALYLKLNILLALRTPGNQHSEISEHPILHTNEMTEAVAQRCSMKKAFLEILQNSQENTCATVYFLIKLQAFCNFIKKETIWHRCFPVNSAKFLRNIFLQNTSGGCFWMKKTAF